MAILHLISAAAKRRAAYRRTRDALRSMSLHVSHDLDIDRSQADRIAHRAVYGH